MSACLETIKDHVGCKIINIEDIDHEAARLRSSKKRIVHCHGIFDLLHPGHIQHFQEAKAQGDILVVSITPDHFVNKGPGRPAFHETLRLKQLASLACVDYVVLNDAPDAVYLIEKIKPDIYVKGSEYSDPKEDLTGKISQEAEAVKKYGGAVYYTQGAVFSSSHLINHFFDRDAERINPFMASLKNIFSERDILRHVEQLSDLKVLIVGDAIIDEYQYVRPLGQSGKGLHMTAACLEKEVFLGGALIIANHVAGFVKEATLLTAVGKDCCHLPFIKKALRQNIVPRWITVTGSTLAKKRYVLKDGDAVSKLFETYSSTDQLLDKSQTEEACSYLREQAGNFDLVLVADFGNGFTNPMIIDALSQVPAFLSLNTQTNSGNRGFQVVTHYQRADFISLNEPELRLAAHDRYSRVEALARDIAELMHCNQMSVTRGVNGVYHYSRDEESVSIPALTMHAIDRVGAGDCYFAIASLCASKGHPPLITGFLGSVAAAMGVQVVGNKEALDKTVFSKYAVRLLK